MVDPENVMELLVENWLLIGITVGMMALVSYLLQMNSVLKTLPPAIQKAEFTVFPLIHLEDVSHNTKLFRFGLKHPRQSLELPIGKHISVLGYDENNEEVRRPYTPTTLADTLGHFDLVVKIYPDGKMSQVFDKLTIGKTLKFRGPMGRFKYETNMKSFFGMVAGGTGITPIFQAIKAILENPEDKTNLSLIFGNITEDDILLKPELDSFQVRAPPPSLPILSPSPARGVRALTPSARPFSPLIHPHCSIHHSLISSINESNRAAHPSRSVGDILHPGQAPSGVDGGQRLCDARDDHGEVRSAQRVEDDS